MSESQIEAIRTLLAQCSSADQEVIFRELRKNHRCLYEMEKDVPHRAARLYKFDSKKYRQLTKKGFAFDV